MAQQCAIVTGSMKHPESTSLPPCQSDLHPQTWQRELLLPPSRSSVRAQARGGHAPSSPALSAASISSSRGGMPLAAGWEVRHSKSKNRPFYVNKTTGGTQWEHPGVVSNMSRVLNECVVHGQNWSRCVRQYRMLEVLQADRACRLSLQQEPESPWTERFSKT